MEGGNDFTLKDPKQAPDHRRSVELDRIAHPIAGKGKAVSRTSLLIDNSKLKLKFIKIDLGVLNIGV